MTNPYSEYHGLECDVWYVNPTYDTIAECLNSKVDTADPRYVFIDFNEGVSVRADMIIRIKFPAKI